MTRKGKRSGAPSSPESKLRAEEKEAAGVPLQGAAVSPEDLQRALHELRVRQTELEMQNEERHRTIIHTAMDGFWLVDQHTRLIEVNAA